MTNVVSLHGEPVQRSDGTIIPLDTSPNERLIQGLKELLVLAESGELRNFMGFGFRANGLVTRLLEDTHPNAYEVTGALEAIRHDYLNGVRHG